MSSDDIVIQVDNLGKCYHIYDSARDRLKQAFIPKLSKFIRCASTVSYYRDFWALKDVSFEVRQGETVGIIGRNGSGKSTLLQMIAGTLLPTTGTVDIKGRAAALLELGAGFNPEFTGVENIFMNATVLGLKTQDIQNKFDSIAAFADIGGFLNQPVKHYSSGMYARLAFAVAINVDPSILIVDEALAVGDEPFQRKCFSKIEKIKNDGAAILFVSHSGSAVTTLCDRALLLHKGKCLYTGVPKRAVFFNQKIGNSKDEDISKILDEIGLSKESEDGEVDVSTCQSEKNQDSLKPLIQAKEFLANDLVSNAHAYEERGARIQNIALMTKDNIAVNQIFRGREYRLECEIVFEQACPNCRIYALIRTITGIDLAGCAYPQLENRGFDASKGSIFRVEFPFVCCLNPDTYFCNFALQSEDGSLHHRIVDAIAFKVMADIPNPATGLVDVGFKPHFYQLAVS